MVEDVVAKLASDPPDLSDRRVVCLPDFYVDHLVDTPSWTDLFDEAEDVLTSGGGNVHDVGQKLFPGGQSANVARVLAGLGVDAALLAPTGPAGRALAEHWLGGLGVDVDGMVEDQTSLTVAFETHRANVMLNDAGGLTDVTVDDLGLPGSVADADWVVLSNWAQIGDGDVFVGRVLAACEDRDIPVLFDPGDPRPIDDHDLLHVLSQYPPALLSVNDVESDAFGLAKDSPVPTLPRGEPGPVVVHTEDEATLTRPDGKKVKAPALDVDPVRRTGAGDAFNAGLVVGDLLDLDDASRLGLAHAVAAAAITRDDPEIGWADVGEVVGRNA